MKYVYHLQSPEFVFKILITGDLQAALERVPCRVVLQEVHAAGRFLSHLPKQLASFADHALHELLWDLKHVFKFVKLNEDLECLNNY